jgi:hypothetical protein
VKIVAAGFAALALAVALTAQTSGARLGGDILDPSGARIARALVTVVNDNTGARGSATSDDQGSFLFPSLAPGAYTVAVEARGFSRKVLRRFDLSASEIANEVITLELGDVAATIEWKPQFLKPLSAIRTYALAALSVSVVCWVLTLN